MTSVEHVSPESLRCWLQGPNPPVVVDVREDSYFKDHVKGSILLPASIFLAYIPWLREQIHDNRRVVFYDPLLKNEGRSCSHYFARNNADDECNVFMLDKDITIFPMTSMSDPLIEERDSLKHL